MKSLKHYTFTQNQNYITWKGNILSSRPGLGPGPSKKVGSASLERAGATPKFTVFVKNPFLTNSWVLI